MFLRRLSRLTSTVQGLVSQAHHIHVSCSYHASSVKATDEDDSVPHKEQPSLSMESLSAEEMIWGLEAKTNSIKGSHLVMALNTISHQYKNNCPSQQGESLVRKVIPILIQNKKKLSGEQALEIVKIFDQLKIARGSKIYTTMLQHILPFINDLSVKSFFEISDIALDEAIDPGLRGDLQAALEEKLLVKSSMNFDKNDSEFYGCALHLISQSPQLSDKHNLFEILMKNLCNSDVMIPLDSAILIYKSLYHLQSSRLKTSALYKLQSDLAEQAHLFDRDQVKEMINLLVGQEHPLEDCYNKSFVDALVKRVIDGRFDGCLSSVVLTKLHKLRHKSPELLHYTCNAVSQESVAIGSEKARQIMWSLLSEFALARYKPIFWIELQNAVPKLALEFCKTPQSFVHLAQILMSLDWFPNPIVEKIFDGSFRPSILSPPSRMFCRCYQIAKLDAFYDGPMPTDSQIADLELLMQKSHLTRKNRPLPLLIHLKEGMKDPACIQTDIKTQFFHELDYVAGFYQDGTPAPISVNSSNVGSSNGIRYIEDLSVPPGAKLVILQFLSRTRYFRNTHELMGNYYLASVATERLPYLVVFINGCTWFSLPVEKRTSFIMDTVKSKLKSAS